MVKVLSEMTYPEILNLKNLKLVLPIVSLLNSDIRNFRLDDDEYLLPPLYKECLSEKILQSIIKTLELQLPSITTPSVSNIRIIEANHEKEYLKYPQKIIFSTDPLEQHAHHLCVATDPLLSDCFIKNALNHFCDKSITYTPPVRWGCLKWGMTLGGSISIKEEDLYEIIKNYINYFLNKGCRKFYLVSTHLAKNHKDVLASVVETFTDCKIHLTFPLTYLKKTETDCHAGEVETALSLFNHLPVKYDKLFSPLYFDQCYSKKYLEQFIYQDFDGACRKVSQDHWNGVVGEFELSKNTEDFIKYLKDRGSQYNMEIVTHLLEWLMNA